MNVCNRSDCASFNAVFENNCAKFEIQESKRCRYYKQTGEQNENRNQRFWDFLKGKEMK